VHNLDNYLNYLNRYSNFSEVYFSGTLANGISFKNGSLSQVSSSNSSGYAFRALDRSISFGATNEEEWSIVKEHLDRVIENSRVPGRNKLSNEGVFKDKWEVAVKRKIEDMALEDKISILKDIDQILIEKKIPMRILSIADIRQKEILVNSEGTEIEGDISKVAFFGVIGYYENGNFEQRFIQLGFSGGYEALEYWDLFNTISNEAEALKRSVIAKSINPGYYDLVVGPEISGIVAHESAGHPMELDRILGREMSQAGESFIKFQDMGKQVGSQHVNVVDDPTIEHSYGYYKYDRDGVKAKKRYLYKNGLINEFLSNRESAGRVNLKSTAASRISEWDKDPIPRMSTTFIEPGEYSLEELIEDVKLGIYMKSYNEWNIDDIRFNEKYVGLEAYILENGRIGEQIRRPTLETTTIKFYSSIDAVGKDLKFFAGTCGKGDPMQGVDVWMGGPHARLRNIYMR